MSEIYPFLSLQRSKLGVLGLSAVFPQENLRQTRTNQGPVSVSVDFAALLNLRSFRIHVGSFAGVGKTRQRTTTESPALKTCDRC